MRLPDTRSITLRRFGLLSVPAVLLVGCTAQPPGPAVPVECDATAAAQVEMNVAPEDPVVLGFEAAFDERGEFIAPVAKVNLSGSDRELAIKFGAREEAWEAFGAEVASNDSRPRTISFGVRTEAVYGPLADTLSSAPVMLPAESTVRVTHEDGSVSEGVVASDVLVLLAMEPPVEDCGLFDCHSHWSLFDTECHCNTAGCCPGETCQCRFDGAQSCGGLQFCFCD